jgi:CxxC motif-containing protein (DUF1111 family)
VSVRRRLAAIGGLIACALAVYAIAGGASSSGSGDPALSGGKGATVYDVTENAFAQPDPDLTDGGRRVFAIGNSLFNRNWVTAPASTTGTDGLGPVFNAQSCSSCHFKDGRARPPEAGPMPDLGLLLRLSVVDRKGNSQPVPHYGGQLQDHSILGVPAEGRIRITYTKRRGRFADGKRYTLLAPHYAIVDRAFGPLAKGTLISPRVAPAVFGVGLLEAVPEKTISDRADPQDADGDGISGRPNRVDSVRLKRKVLGRFGWKANQPSVEQQNAAAFNGDIGITSFLFGDQGCPKGQTACKDAPTGGSPEVNDKKLRRVVFYAQTLAVPARRAVGRPETSAGENIFDRIGCSSCHLPELKTGSSDIPALSKQTIHPYTDLLLHDMGPALADHRPDGLASGSEWRTAPLWGIGLVHTVNRHTRFLHDGRARSIEEAILWHGGEAAGAQRRFTELPARERHELLMFLGSL